MTIREPSDASTLPATTRRPLPSAPRVGSRSSLVETIGRLMQNRRAISSGVAVDAGAVVLDEVAAVRPARRCGPGAGVERVVGQLLQHQPAQLVRRDAGLLLQPLDGAEGGPVGPLEFQIWSCPVSLLTRRSDFQNRSRLAPRACGQFVDCVVERVAKPDTHSDDTARRRRLDLRGLRRCFGLGLFTLPKPGHIRGRCSRPG